LSRSAKDSRRKRLQKHWKQAIDYSEIKPNYPDLKLHLIGPLQTNKVSHAVELFDCIETIDRPKLAKELAKEIKKQGRDIPCFIQVNTGEEEQKSGVSTKELPELLNLCKEEGLNITGLMCIPPVDEPAALHFGLLNKLAKQNGLEQLSMGMSADFQKAIPLGATYIRVGTAIFGNREK
jgi:pyridoxal phosphate enzyme (YggS family)